MCNLLTEPVIRFRHTNGTVCEASLPEVHSALMADEVASFPAQRPHQRHAWHAFLVQLGAMAMHRAGLDTPPTDADEWRRIIRALTPDFSDDEPWQLIVDDVTKPAFMQPPARSQEREKDYKNAVTTPDSLDMLVTSKNHDLKAEIVEQANADDWIFALITLQTMEGYGGRYNYGISRMPSGYGNRSAISLTPSVRPGTHFKHDLITLLKNRQSILDEHPMTESGIALLWVFPWDGTKSESKLLGELDPYYIEVCRRVRLVEQSGRITAIRANSDERRIADVKGLTGDPWALVSNNANPRGTPPAFLGRRKFGYERIVDGLFSPDWKAPFLLSPEVSQRDSDSDMQLVARGMVRGEGGTEGYHERIIRLRPRTLQVFGRPGGIKTLEDISRERIQRISDVEGILRRSVATFAAKGKARETGSPNDIDIKDEHWSRAKLWVDKLSELMDVDFFEDLQDEALADDSQRQNERKKWLQKLADNAESILYDAIQSLPCPEIHRPRAQARAVNGFRSGIQRFLGVTELLQDSSKENAEWQTNNQSTQTDSPTET